MGCARTFLIFLYFVLIRFSTRDLGIKKSQLVAGLVLIHSLKLNLASIRDEHDLMLQPCALLLELCIGLGVALVIEAPAFEWRTGVSGDKPAICENVALLGGHRLLSIAGHLPAFASLEPVRDEDRFAFAEAIVHL